MAKKRAQANHQVKPKRAARTISLQMIPLCQDMVGTYSIIAYDPETAAFGVAVQSRYFNVGTVVPWAQAGVGAVATQAHANIVFGRLGLKRMAAGESAQEALDHLLADDEGRERRQVAMIDSSGHPAVHTGSACPEFAGHQSGPDYAVQGNWIEGPGVLQAMAAAFEAERARGQPLGSALVAALQAAEDAGGDRRGRQSAALLVVREHGGYGHDNDRYIDLRVEDHPQPTHELARLLALHQEAFPGRHPKADG